MLVTEIADFFSERGHVLQIKRHGCFWPKEVVWIVLLDFLLAKFKIGLQGGVLIIRIPFYTLLNIALDNTGGKVCICGHRKVYLQISISPYPYCNQY